MKILVTAFDAFGGESVNPALEAVKLLDDIIAKAEITKLELPTAFRRSLVTLEETMERVHFDAVLCVGQAGGRFDITLERVAINIDDANIADNDGYRPIDLPIYADGAPAYFSTLPIKAMAERIRNGGIPASVSNSAGTFVCNHVMYGLLYLIDKKFPDVRGGFIHVPFIVSQAVQRPMTPSLSLTDIARGLTLAIEAIVESKISGGSES